MSSHREAPEISKDPSPTTPTPTPSSARTGPTRSRSSRNYIPLEDPAGGPNFFEFGDDVLYRINIDNDGDGRADVVYEFAFHDDDPQPEHVPLQHRADRLASTSPNFNRPQTYTVTEVRGGRRSELGTDLLSPAVQRRAPLDAELRRRWPTPRSTTSATASRCSPASGSTGSTSTSASVFDLAALRPFQNLHLIPTAGRGRHQRVAGVQRAHASPSRCRSAS